MTDSKKIKAPDNKAENTEKKDNTNKKKNNGYTRLGTQPYSEPYPIDPDLD